MLYFAAQCRSGLRFIFCIMAKPIKETPILYDSDAERLEMVAHNVVPLTDEERKEIIRAYDDVRKCCAL